MSALILMAHPRDGAEIAREHGIPEAVIRFMLEHHGTTLIKFFYERARNLAKEGDVVDEEAFRYPGPKPSTKESGIVSLADPIEAIVRTLSEPTPASMERIIESVVEDRIRDGQLDDCNLTMREIRQIKDAFLRILLSMFHSRITYPTPPPPTRSASKGGEEQQQQVESSLAAKPSSS